MGDCRHRRAAAGGWRVNGRVHHGARRAVRAALAGCVLAWLGACGAPQDEGFQGYAEGEYVAVGVPVAGRLERLAVQRGDRVQAGATLFVLESRNEQDALHEAQAQLAAAQAQLADLKTGRRAAEQAVIRAELAIAEANAGRAQTQLARDEAQFRAGGVAQAQLDDDRAALAAARARVVQVGAELAVARLAGRGEQIAAQAAQVEAARAVVEQAKWRIGQMSIAAISAGEVTDTLFRVGEWVPAGTPVVRILPPQNIVLRFFVPETVVGSLKLGRAVAVTCDGCGGEIAATLSHVSSRAEFTPPVIYSNETRSKLVFMVEARPAAGEATRLHPGQPVSVVLR